MTTAMQTEPEQWAVELWIAAYDSFENCATQSFGDDDKAAALAIQRAFEDQTRKLRDLALSCVAIEANRWPENDDVQQALKTLSRRIAHAALKETPDAQ